MGSADRNLAYRLFTTTVGLITTNGSKGPNVMSAEWTFNVSYDPFLILVLLEPGEATFDAIQETGEFGVSLVAEEQVTAMGFAGHFTKHETDKLSSELFETYPAKRISVPMIQGALLNAECRVVQSIVMGDHAAFVGEVLEFTADPSKRPVVLHRGAHQLGPRIPRPPTIAVAVTPMVSPRGGTVIIDGEFTAAERGGKPVELSVMASDGGAHGSVRTLTDHEGYFQATLQLSRETPPGAHMVVAQSGGVEGRAQLTIE